MEALAKKKSSNASVGSGTKGLAVVREIKPFDYDEIVRNPKVGILRQPTVPQPEPAPAPAPAAPLAPQPVKRLFLNAVQLAENAKLGSVGRLKMCYKSPLSDVQKKQVLDFNNVFKDPHLVSKFTEIPQPLVTHFLYEHERETVVEKAVVLLNEGLTLIHVSHRVWRSPAALTAWLTAAGHEDLLKNAKSEAQKAFWKSRRRTEMQ